MIEWVPARNIRSLQLRLNDPPSKTVLEQLDRIENGESPPVKVTSLDNLVVLEAKNKAIWEAYVRLHLSYVPIVKVWKEADD